MSGIVTQNVLGTSGLIKSPAGGGAWNFISKQTASSSATIDFTSGIDSTYKEYIFTFKDIHPQTDGEDFGFQANAAGGSGYNETITSTAFRAYNNENGEGEALGYRTGQDQAQGTGFQVLIHEAASDDADKNACGTLHLFDPSNTTFAKHFLFIGNHIGPTDFSRQWFIAGYFNTTSALDEIQFKMSDGNIDAGKIKLFGIKDS